MQTRMTWRSFHTCDWCGREQDGMREDSFRAEGWEHFNDTDEDLCLPCVGRRKAVVAEAIQLARAATQRHSKDGKA